MPQPNTLPAWVTQHPLTKNIISQFTVEQWIILDEEGFSAFLDAPLLLESGILAINSLIKTNPRADFTALARQVIENLNTVQLPSNEFVMPDLQAVESWLGHNLFMRAEDELGTFQQMDTLATALTNPTVCDLMAAKIDQSACSALRAYVSKDLRQLLEAREITYPLFVDIAHQVNLELKSLTRKKFPKWAVGLETQLLLNSFSAAQIATMSAIGFNQLSEHDLTDDKVVNYIATVVRQIKLECHLSGNKEGDEFRNLFLQAMKDARPVIDVPLAVINLLLNCLEVTLAPAASRETETPSLLERTEEVSPLSGVSHRMFNHSTRSPEDDPQHEEEPQNGFRCSIS